MISKHRPFYRPTWAEVDLRAVRHNVRVLRRHLPRGTRMMVAVKANAYGHGLLEVSKALAAGGIDYLGVACMDEAVALRSARVKTPILCLGAYFKDDVEAIVRHDVTATVIDLNRAKALDRCARRLHKCARVHVKVDTGMGRLGLWHEDADDLILKLCALKNLSIEGIYTHFPSADVDEAFTRSQIAAFCALVERLEIRGVRIPLKHTANSMAVVGFKEAHFNLVRPGLAVYGMHPKDELLGRLDLAPVMSFHTKIAYLKNVAPGRSISYGRTHVTGSPTLIATLPVGYGDGYNRQLSNRGHVLVRGKMCPIGLFAWIRP
jgi:alanine racemase